MPPVHPSWKTTQRESQTGRDADLCEDKLVESSFKGTRRTKKKKLYCKRITNRFRGCVSGLNCRITRCGEAESHSSCTLHIFQPFSLLTMKMMMKNYLAEINYYQITATVTEYSAQTTRCSCYTVLIPHKYHI